MIKLVIVKNPFQPWKDRIIKNVPNGFTARQIVDLTEFKGMEINCSVNGEVVEMTDSYVVPNDNIVVLSPVVAKGGKSTLGIVAMVAMAAISVGAGLLVSQGLSIAGSTIIGAGTFSAYMAAAAVMFIGSTLVGRLTTNSANIDKGSYENEQTYSWNGVQTMEGQNNPITMTYGKLKSGGQTIGKNITVKDNKEYLNWLVSAGEGELSITNIKLNDNDISNYGDVEVETRSGTNDQTVIPYFNDTYFTKNLGYQLLDDEVIDIAQGTGTEKLIVKVEFSNGLYYAKDNGKLGNAWVDLEGWYRKKNTSTWTKMFEDRVTGNKSSAIRKEYATSELPQGEYEVKLKVKNRQYSVTNSRASTRCWWSSLTSVVFDDFSYPNIALIGIKALATDQLNGTPSLSFIKERKYVWVYNPNTQEYEQQNANNPAWASYDMLHLASKIKNINTGNYEFDVRGAKKELLIYEQFKEWATYCDYMKLYVNIEVTQAGELLDVINSTIANCGRGMVIRYGTKYGCVWDAIKQPVQMFGMGNIITGTFNEEFLPTSDRANCVEVTYMDADNDYSRETITIYSDDYDNAPEEKIAQMTYNGITSYEQAYREGKYQLYCNKYLLRTVTFEANIDAIACTVGDVILVAHDVPKWAYSGRIYSVDIANRTMRLPVEIENVNKNYRIAYRTVNDNLRESQISIIENENGWCTVRCNSGFTNDDLPQANDIFDIAEINIGSKPFVVKSISRATDFTRKISCLEYNANVYGENYEIPPINYSSADTNVENVTNLIAKQNKQLDENGSYQYNFEATWEYDKSASFIIYVSYDGYNFVKLENEVNDRQYQNVLQSEVVYIKVVTRNGIRQSTGVTRAVETVGEIVLPSPTNVVAYNKYRELNDDIVRYDIEVKWDVPNFEGYKQCQVWYKTNGTQANDIGVIQSGVSANDVGFYGSWLFGGQGYDSVIIPQAIIGDTYRIAVCTEDIYGNVISQNKATQTEILVATKTETPNTPSGLRVSFTDTFNIYWNEVRNSDVKYYEVRTNTNFGADIGLVTRTTENYCNANNITNRTGTIYVYSVSVYDKHSAPAYITYSKEVPKQPKQPKVSATLTGLNIMLDDIPSDCISINLVINDYEFTLNEQSFTYNCPTGIYSVKYCFNDIFGSGTYSAEVVKEVLAYIEPELIQAETFNTERMSEGAKTAIGSATVPTINVAVQGILGNGSALVMDNGNLSLVASNGKKLTGLFANDDGTMRLQGDYIHVTGNTVFDEDVIIKGQMVAGSISCDEGVSINAGALTVNGQGVTINVTDQDSPNGTVTLNSKGITYNDKNGIAYAGVGRYIMGECEDGDYIRFNTDWVKTPTVTLVPKSINQDTFSHMRGTISIEAEVKELSSKGFRASIGYYAESDTALLETIANLSYWNSDFTSLVTTRSIANNQTGTTYTRISDSEWNGIVPMILRKGFKNVSLAFPCMLSARVSETNGVCGYTNLHLRMYATSNDAQNDVNVIKQEDGIIYVRDDGYTRTTAPTYCYGAISYSLPEIATEDITYWVGVYIKHYRTKSDSTARITIRTEEDITCESYNVQGERGKIGSGFAVFIATQTNAGYSIVKSTNI